MFLNMKTSRSGHFYNANTANMLQPILRPNLSSYRDTKKQNFDFGKNGQFDFEFVKGCGCRFEADAGELGRRAGLIVRCVLLQVCLGP